MNSSTGILGSDTSFLESFDVGVWYVGFPAQEKYEALVKEYTALAHEKSTIPNDLIRDTLSAFMDNALNHYFVMPLDTLQATETHRKIVMIGVNTIKKAVGAVLPKVVAKMAADDRVKLAQYMDVMLTQVGEANPQSMVIYPIEDTMADSARQILQRGRNGEALAIKGDLQQLLISVNEEAMKAYFDIPFRMMSFGPIMSKLITMTADATRAATQVVIKKVVSGLKEEEVFRILDYVEALFIKGPPHSGPLES